MTPSDNEWTWHHAVSQDPPHATTSSQVATALNGDPAIGLSDAEVTDRRENYGANTMRSIRSRPSWRILIDQFRSPIVALLGVAAGVSVTTEEPVEAAAILVVLALNTLIGFFTEWQAGRALEALRRQTRMNTRVRRAGRERMLDAEMLVPGDIIVLNPGDSVPADARLLEAADLATEESALTGESTPVEKSIVPTPLDAALGDRHSMVFLGTGVVTGRALAVITSTGIGTELGRIGQLVADAPDETAPLERRLAQLGRRLVYLVFGIAVVVMVTGWLRGDGRWVMVKVDISLAVAAVPESLPAVTTLILALGVLRMARQHALVRRLPAVETLGSATVICSDKTGTLTENRMAVTEYYLSDGRIVEIEQGRRTTDRDQLLDRTLRAGVLCNEASFEPDSAAMARAIGDPTEIALLLVAHGLDLDIADLLRKYPKLDERPFHSATKRMITLHRAGDSGCLAANKGAPAIVLDTCSAYLAAAGIEQPMDDAARARFLAINEGMADRSLRVLGLAEKRFDAAKTSLFDADLDTGYTFLGFVGMVDPPRAGVAEAIRRAHRAGIRTIMLTGDQINTARAIARELDLAGGEEPLALHARDLATNEPLRLAQQVMEVDVFARVSAEDKLRIVEALASTGEIVAVTGDGVNDAPALKRADIGIAMGQRGTEVAKEAADIVLSDDNFATIILAVEGGRTIYANIIRFVHMMFSHNLGEVIAIFVAIVLGWPLPLLPLQILWMNLVTDVFPGLALALEPSSPEIMNQPPRSPRTTLLSPRFLFLIAWQGAMLAMLALAAYAWALGRYGAGSHARSVALFALVGVELGHLFNCRSRTRSTVEGLFRNPWLWMATVAVLVLQLFAVFFSPVAAVLDLVRPTANDLFVVVAVTLAPILIVEITKAFARIRRRSNFGVTRRSGA